jgi:hypothetical protein
MRIVNHIPSAKGCVVFGILNFHRTSNEILKLDSCIKNNRIKSVRVKCRVFYNNRMFSTVLKLVRCAMEIIRP